MAKKLKELTEPDLLKAGEKDYMNEAQLAFFKQRLLDLRAQLLNNADDTGQHHLRRATRSRPTRQIAPRWKRNTRWSCARATASGSF